jgi:NADH:ubiquinone oxidoreductase subunit K
MTAQVILLQRISLVLCCAIFVSGLATILLRRVAAWILVGQLFALKAVAACAFLLSRLTVAGGGDLVVTSLVALGFVPSVAAVGTLVLHRCRRFDGTLDVDEETGLRN